MPKDADVPDGTNLSFHFSGMIADHRRNLGWVRKIETLPILQICPRSSQTIGDIYDFEFSLVGKIWDGLGFSRHMKTRLKEPILTLNYSKSLGAIANLEMVRAEYTVTFDKINFNFTESNITMKIIMESYRRVK